MSILEFYFLFLSAMILIVPSGSKHVGKNIFTNITNHGVLIVTGTSVSTLFLFHWEHDRSPEFYVTNLSFPVVLTNSQSVSFKFSSFSSDYPKLVAVLKEFIQFAVQSLSLYLSSLSSYPIYFKGTGSFRSMSENEQSKLIKGIRSVLNNKTLSPFYFESSFARIISGEEEASSSWAAVNFYQKSLQQSSLGFGAASSLSTSGIIDLQESSLELSFFLPSQNIMNNLFQYRMGGQKSWNLYAASYQDYGYKSGFNRHLEEVANSVFVPPNSAVVPSALDYCFYSGYSENRWNTNKTYNVQIWGPAVPAGNQLSLCMESLSQLLFQDSDTFCDRVYKDECGIDGEYQPNFSLLAEEGDKLQFVGLSIIPIAWEFLNLPAVASIQQFQEASATICMMTFDDIMSYYEANPAYLKTPELAETLPYFCMLNSYILVILLG